MSVRLRIAALALSGIMGLGRPAAAAPCVGDCRDTGRVSVNDIVTGVSIALGREALEVCAALDANGDAKVSVDELPAGGGQRPERVQARLPHAVW